MASKSVINSREFDEGVGRVGKRDYSRTKAIIESETMRTCRLLERKLPGVKSIRNNPVSAAK